MKYVYWTLAAALLGRQTQSIFSWWLKLALTHLSLASLLWDIGKQYSPRCDAAEHGIPSEAILFAYRNCIEKWNKILNSHLRPLKMKCGLVQFIMMGESIRQICVKQYFANFVEEFTVNLIDCAVKIVNHFQSWFLESDFDNARLSPFLIILLFSLFMF